MSDTTLRDAICTRGRGRSFANAWLAAAALSALPACGPEERGADTLVREAGSARSALLKDPIPEPVPFDEVQAAATVIGSLRGVEAPPVIERNSGLPLVPNFVVDKELAIALGKALYWDQQVGSDGMACASCHFHAGSDARRKNQLNPGPAGGGNGVFDPTRTGGGGPNYVLKAGDFPTTSDDVVSSSGTFAADFLALRDAQVGDSVTESRDACAALGIGTGGDPFGFHVGGVNVRRSEPRHAPTVINTGLHFLSFWDGRARAEFNGRDPFGQRNPDALILQVQGDGTVSGVPLAFEPLAAASQAVGPPLSTREMSCGARTFAHLGKKLLSRTPLGLQHVHQDDSVLGAFAALGAPGLDAAYGDMIAGAFHTSLWDSDELFDVTGASLGTSGLPSSPDEYTLMEVNFSLFWGIAIALYEATLISDAAPFDDFVDGHSDALSEQQKAGLQLFVNEGKCVACHATAMFTKASTLHLIDERNEEGLVERMLMGQEQHSFTLQTGGQIQVGRERWQISIDAGGTPVAVGVAATGASASGTIQMTRLVPRSTTPCAYTVDAFTLDPDGDSGTAGSTDDALIHATLSSTPSGKKAACAAGLSVMVRIDESVQTPYGELTGDGETEPFFAGYYAIGSGALRGPALYDNGSYNIGTRPTSDDIAVGGLDPFGNALSYTRQYIDLLLGKNAPDPFQIDECTFEVRFDPAVDIFLLPGGFDPIACRDGSTAYRPKRPDDIADPALSAAQYQAIQNLRTAVDGAFRVPTLRNVALNGPFFHHGGSATLDQVVRFYNRGGDFARANDPNTDPDIQPLGLSEQQIAQLVSFLEALTDPRVACKAAPFDHPQLFLPSGHVGDELTVLENTWFAGHAEDEHEELPAVGAAGLSNEGLPCLPSFEELLAP